MQWPKTVFLHYFPWPCPCFHRSEAKKSSTCAGRSAHRGGRKLRPGARPGDGQPGGRPPAGTGSLPDRGQPCQPLFPTFVRNPSLKASVWQVFIWTAVTNGAVRAVVCVMATHPNLLRAAVPGHGLKGPSLGREEGRPQRGLRSALFGADVCPETPAGPIRSVRGPCRTGCSMGCHSAWRGVGLVEGHLLPMVSLQELLFIKGQICILSQIHYYHKYKSCYGTSQRCTDSSGMSSLASPRCCFPFKHCHSP